MNHTHLLYSAQSAFVAAFLIFAIGVCAFFAFEPSVGRAITDDFTVTQEITDEVSFLVAANNVTMVGTIAGLTGGYATGTTMAVVRSNDPQGYTMTLQFSSSTAMWSGTNNTSINNYTPASTTGGIADFLWIDNASGGAAEFGYTVRASTTGEVDLSFRNDGSACNTGSSETNDRCWLNPSTTPETIIATTGAVLSSTSTIKFKVAVPNNPSPAVPAGFYTATGTLTATTNP